jgi:hypothetical protein
VTKYVWNGRKWVENGQKQPLKIPFLVSDHMDPLMHPCTGEMIDSKSRFRAVTRAHGCFELGNDAPVAQKRAGFDRNRLRADIDRAIGELEAGRPAPVGQREGGMTRRYNAE